MSQHLRRRSVIWNKQEGKSSNYFPKFVFQRIICLITFSSGYPLFANCSETPDLLWSCDAVWIIGWIQHILMFNCHSLFHINSRYKVTMHRSTCTNELELTQNKRLDLDSDDDLQNETENEDPASIGTPVCLPAVVWFENCDGENESRMKISIFKISQLS